MLWIGEKTPASYVKESLLEPDFSVFLPTLPPGVKRPRMPIAALTQRSICYYLVAFATMTFIAFAEKRLGKKRRIFGWRALLPSVPDNASLEPYSQWDVIMARVQGKELKMLGETLDRLMQIAIQGRIEAKKSDEATALGWRLAVEKQMIRLSGFFDEMHLFWDDETLLEHIRQELGACWKRQFGLYRVPKGLTPPVPTREWYPPDIVALLELPQQDD